MEKKLKNNLNIYDFFESGRYLLVYNKTKINKMNDKVTELMNEFVKLNNLANLAKEKQDYEECCRLRSIRTELEKAVFNNIVLPYIPMRVEYLESNTK